MSDEYDEDTGEVVEGPGVGAVDPKEFERLREQFRKLTPEERMKMLFDATTEDLYLKIISGQASHQDAANALKAVKDAGVTIIAPPPTPQEARAIENATSELPAVLPDYSEDEEEWKDG